MSTHTEKQDYESPKSLTICLAAECFVCTSGSMNTGMEDLVEDPYTWTIDSFSLF